MLVRWVATRIQRWLLSRMPWNWFRAARVALQQRKEPTVAASGTSMRRSMVVKKQKSGQRLSRSEQRLLYFMYRARRRRLLLLISASFSRLPPSKLLWTRLFWTGMLAGWSTCG